MSIFLGILLLISLVMFILNYFRLKEVKERSIEAEERTVTHFRKLLAVENEIRSYKTGKNPFTTLRDIEKVIYPNRQATNR